MVTGKDDKAVADVAAGQTVEEPQTGSAISTGRSRSRSRSMHDGIAVWCDCCSCEAEPYWVEIAPELGIDPGSDYEDDESGA